MDPFTLTMAAGLVGGVFGGIKNARERKKQRRALEKRKNALSNTFNREYYQDYLDREQSKSFLSQMRDRMKDANKVASNTAVITGATDESKIAQKSALQKNYGQALNQMAGMASQHKDNAMNWYQNALTGTYAEEQQQLGHKAQQWGNFTNNAMNAVTTFASLKGGA